MEGLYVCVGLLAIIAPLLLVVIGTVELHKLKVAVRDLLRRVAELEIRSAEVVARPPNIPAAVTTAAPTVVPVVPPPLPSQPAIPVHLAPATPHQPPPPIDWEAFFGVKLFAWIGGFVLFLGIVFLVKYSFENNLITPVMRVAIGTILGIGLIVTGWLTATRRYRVSGQSLCATGILVLYGNIFAAHVFYHLIALVPAFASMAVVTAVAFFLAIRMDAQVIVVLGLLGGFFTPVLLWTGVDNPIALFGYIAVLNIGIGAVALRRRWDYRVALAAAGTVLMQFAWVGNFFDESKANISVGIFLGFEAQFFAIFVFQRRTLPTSNWTARAAIALGFSALAWGFFLLGYPELGQRPGFLFAFIFVAEAGLLGLALLRPKPTQIVPAAGAIVFFFLALWTAKYLSDALLWWGLGGYVLFAVAHAGFAVWPRLLADKSKSAEWKTYLPLLSLGLIWICVAKNQTSSAVWLCLLVLDFIAVGLAFARRSLAAIATALLLTFFAAFLWISTGPADLDLGEFLVVAAGSGTFFFATSLFAARKFFPESENVKRNIPALAASLPFLLLLAAIAKLPVVNPTPFFITAFFLSVLLLGLGVVGRTSWIALVALVFSWAVENQWQILHFTSSSAAIALGWELAFFLLFFGFPFFTMEERKPLPWAVGALSGPLQFILLDQIITKVFPHLQNGFTPAAFVIPYAAGTLFLIKRRQAEPASGDARLAWQGGVMLLFVSLVFPIQFDREWITL
ncbi:MAG TPA: DUF2339 domain-containing protein, partial [Chthoniobacterales bacterium]